MTQRGTSVARHPIVQSRRHRPESGGWSSLMIAAAAGVITGLYGRERLCQRLSGP